MGPEPASGIVDRRLSWSIAGCACDRAQGLGQMQQPVAILQKFRQLAGEVGVLGQPGVALRGATGLDGVEIGRQDFAEPPLRFGQVVEIVDHVYTAFREASEKPPHPNPLPVGARANG